MPEPNAMTVVPQKSFDMIPTNLTEAMNYATMLSKSSLCPKEMQGKPQDVIVALQLGMSLGLHPMVALQSIAVINSRPTLYGDAFKAVIVASPLCEEFDEDSIDIVTKQGYGRCKIKRRGMPKPIEVKFSIDDAKKAGLWGKAGPWTNYPSRMLQFRARGFCGRDAMPDLLKGVISREEADDYEVLGATREGHQLMRRPTRIDEPTAASVTEKQVDDFLKTGGAKAPAESPGPKDEPAAPASTDGLERVGVLKAEDQKTSKGAPMLAFTVARKDGTTVSGFAFSGHVIEALKRGYADGLGVLVKIEEKKGKDGKMYSNVVEAQVEEPTSDPSPDPEE